MTEREEENLICIYNEAFSAGSQGKRKHRKMDLFMYGFVKDFPQQLKSIQEANYALDCECELREEISLCCCTPPKSGLISSQTEPRMMMMVTVMVRFV